MAYYFSKQSVLDEITNLYADIASKNWQLLIDPGEPAKSLADENEFVSILWSESNKEDEKQIMGMRIFFRIEEDLYTDDQFASDQYMASKHRKTVKDIVLQNKKFLNK